MVCAQCCVSKSHSHGHPLARYEPCTGSGANLSQTWAFNKGDIRHLVFVPTKIYTIPPQRRHTTTLVSLPPLTSKAPLVLNRHAVTSERWPLRRTSRGSVFGFRRGYRRRRPKQRGKTGSACNARDRGRAAFVGEGRGFASRPRRMSHTESRSSAAVTGSLPRVVGVHWGSLWRR